MSAERLHAAPAPLANRTKRILIGRPRATRELEETLLPKSLALPIFSSDPISSVAYATEAALAVLVASSLASRHLVLPISLAVAALLLIVVLSYAQGVRAYASSGGSYVFAKENLGTLPALVAGAALLTDYVLTVAVSVAAGVFAITSAAPSLAAHQVALSLLCIVILTVGNLRGVRESGLLFAFPTYGFIALIYLMLAVGVTKCAVGTCPVAEVPHPVATGTGALGVFVLLKAFSSGAVALTGVESISNGVTAFRRPQSQNAARTLYAMAAIAISFFVAVSWLAVKMDARPSESASVLSQLARGAFPTGSPGAIGYYLVQAFTLAILVLAANTSYQGFPRLAALLARDRFLPSQFVNLGDRLAYSNGIIVLAGLATGLIIAFRANVNSLIHLYVIGVFTAFTLAQAGMVRHWHKTHEPGWRWRATLNAVGAATTLVVTTVVIATKFVDGAWMVIIAIPLQVLVFYGIRRHYRSVGRRLRAKARAVLASREVENRVVLYVERLDAATREALWYAQTISKDSLRAIHVPFPGSDPGIGPRFFHWTDGDPRLEILPPDGEPLDAVLEEIWAIPQGESRFVTVVIPELFRKPSLMSAVLRRSTFSLKLGLLREPGSRSRTCRSSATTSSCHGGLRSSCRSRASTPPRCGRCSTRARSGSPRRRPSTSRSTTRRPKRWSATGAASRRASRSRSSRRRSATSGRPLLSYLREITADPEAVAVVVMPEVVVRGTDRLLHNQRALYMKRLLLFEPRVILTSVPFQLT